MQSASSSQQPAASSQQPAASSQFCPRLVRGFRSPRWPQMAPTWPQDGLRWSQEGPRWPQDGSKMAPGRPKMAQDGPRKAVLGPSWGSKLGSQRFQKCVFRLRETLFFDVGGRLEEEAKPTTAEEPQEEATDCQNVAPRHSRGSLGMRDTDRPEVKERKGRQVSTATAPGSASRTRYYSLITTPTHPLIEGLTRPGPKARRFLYKRL